MSTTHALLIGIDFYFPNRLPDNSSYRSLRGCVRDSNRMAAFLRGRNVPDKQITRLIASNDGSDQPPEKPEQWPTYANMAAAFKRVAAATAPGDTVYIHYSGHGGRTVTAWPDLKHNQLDEALVPTDIGNPGG